MRKINIRLIGITSFLLLLSGCSSIEEASMSSSSSSQATESIEDMVYVVDYVTFDSSIISVSYKEGLTNSYPTIDEKITYNDTDYIFMGWDYTNDGIVDDENFRVNSNVVCKAIYKVSPNITISYSYDGEENSTTIENNAAFSLEVPNNDKLFLYYQDAFGYPYTDNQGNKLASVDLKKSIKLTPFYLERENLPCQVYSTLFPSLKVTGEEEEKLISAINENKAQIDPNDENKIIFDGRKYERVVAQNKGYIFRDYTRCEYNHTYYFRYTPIKWDVYDFSIYMGDLVIKGVTSDIVNYHIPKNKKEQNLNFEYDIFVEWSNSKILESEMTKIEFIDMIGSNLVFNKLPLDSKIIDKVKLASDYAIASMPIEISYEKGTMFHISYSISDLVNELSLTNEVYINNFNGEREKVKSGAYYGELLEYVFVD